FKSKHESAARNAPKTPYPRGGYRRFAPLRSGGARKFHGWISSSQFSANLRLRVRGGSGVERTPPRTGLEPTLLAPGGHRRCNVGPGECGLDVLRSSAAHRAADEIGRALFVWPARRLLCHGAVPRRRQGCAEL